MNIYSGLIVFVFSRIIFISKYPLFFDSPEYLRLVKVDSILEALKLSHQYLHPIYLFSGHWFYVIFSPLIGDRSLSLLSFMASLLGVLSLTAAFKEKVKEKTIFYSLLFFSLFPLTFLLDTNMLHESFDYGLLISGIAFLVLSVNAKKMLFSLISFILMALCLADNPSAIFFLPLILSFFHLLISKKVINLKLISCFLLITASFVSGLILHQLIAWSINIFSPIEYSQTLISGEVAQITNLLSPLGFIRAARNSVYLLAVYLNPLLPIMLALLTFKFIKAKDYPQLVFFTILAITLLIFSSFWYGGLYGRVLFLTTFAFAYFLGSVVNNKIRNILLAISFITFIYNLSFYLKPPIYLMKREVIERYTSDSSIFILSDYERPQLTYPGFYYLTGDNEKNLPKYLEDKLQSGVKVYITSEGLTYPTVSFDGQRPHLIAGNKDKSFVYQLLTHNYLLEEINKTNNFILYRITKK